jgi:hypothetical protein
MTAGGDLGKMEWPRGEMSLSGCIGDSVVRRLMSPRVACIEGKLCELPSDLGESI